MTPLTSWADLVDLYEYRVADMLAGRRPRGGRRALSELREVLHAAPLAPALARRLRESDRQYRAHQRGTWAETGLPSPFPSGPPMPSAGPAVETASGETVSPPWRADMPGDTAEARAWAELQVLAWQSGLRARLEELGRTLQAEPDLLSLRVLYAALETADREDRGMGTGMAVPAAGDPLAALHQPEVAGGLLAALGELLSTPQGQARWRAALARVQETPFPRHPDADVLSARIQAAQREPLAPQAREALIQALRAPHPPERDPRERPAIREAAQRLGQSVAALLENAPAPALGQALDQAPGLWLGGSVPGRRILYAAGPAPLEAPDDASGELVIRLPGGRQARWRGLDLRWQPIGPNWQVQVGGEVTLLRPGRPASERTMTVQTLTGQTLTEQTPGAAVGLSISGDYLRLHLLGEPEQPSSAATAARPESVSGEALGLLAARARVVAALLSPQEHHAHLRLARAAARQLRGGELDAAAFGPASAERYAAAPPGTLLALAHKGAAAMLAHTARLTPGALETALDTAAAALALPPEFSHALHARLRAALVPAPVSELSPGEAPTELPADGQFRRLILGPSPVLLRVPGSHLTLRPGAREGEEGRVLAVLTGQEGVSLDDLLVLPLPVPGAALLLVRQGREVAAAVEPPQD